MPAGRFVLRALVGSVLQPGMTLALPEEIARQARDVLRLRPGDVLTLLDGVGGVYPATVRSLSRRDVEVELSERLEGSANPTPPLTLCLGMLKAARLEVALQKGTELGVAAFQPLVTERAVTVAEELSASKRGRYERILAEALEQCGGAWLPELREPLTLTAALAAIPDGAVALIPWEEAGTRPLRATLRAELAERAPVTGVWLFVGPEGGFSPAEVAEAEARGVWAVTLGRRILRAETAALVAATLALEATGALDQGAGPA